MSTRMHIMENQHTAMRMRLLSLVLFGISIFFLLLFFVYWSANNTSSSLGSTSNDTPLYQLIIAITTLTVTLTVMELYKSLDRVPIMLKYSIIIANTVLIGLGIHQLTKGSDDLFGTDDQSTVEYTYAGLGVGFAGVGTLLCIIHNFYGIVSYL